MKYTDKTIEVECSECIGPIVWLSGLDDIAQHLVEEHGYSAKDAVERARDWADDKYEAIQIREMEISQ